MRALAVAVVVAFGAATPASSARAETGAYWVRSPAPTPLTSPALMTPDVIDGRLVLFSGLGHRGLDGTFTPTNSTWTFDGSAWTRHQPATKPTFREQAAMAHDAARDEVVLFGGRGTGFPGTLADTWVWDGTTWTRRFPATSPPDRWGAAMTYDAARQVVLLFGGWAPALGGLANDMWAWDGTTWTQLPAPPVAPSRRVQAAMTYNAVTRQVVLFGGDDGYPLGDTWYWDGASWSSRDAQPGLAPRQSAALAADPRTGQVVLFGGRGLDGWLGDTWVDTGDRWVRVTTPLEPEARYDAGFVYFASQDRFVLAAGYHPLNVKGAVLGADPPFDTWFFDYLEG